jgi:hypothetical protein
MGSTVGREARWRSRHSWAAVAAWIGVVAAGQWLGRTAGSTRAERHALLPGDELVNNPTVVTNHGVTIPVPPERVWPWLVQMGWHRGGWYTARWVDRLLFPANWPSATHLVPELQQPLEVGDHVPDGPPDTAWFVVEQVDPSHLLVLHSTTHLPAAWRARLSASIDWTWTFTLADTDDGGTRLLLRVRGRTRPWWLTAAYVAALVPADYIMAHSMLAGISRRCAGRAPSPRNPVADSPQPVGSPADRARQPAAWPQSSVGRSRPVLGRQTSQP